MVPIATAAPITPPQVIDLGVLVEQTAEEYGVSASVMKAVIECESQWNITALGDNGESRGLVQIHRPSWPDITDAEAYTPEFAIDFLARKLSEGKGRLWTCYRNL
jgi:hypothetical protein